jgi:hypothetical protein
MFVLMMAAYNLTRMRTGRDDSLYIKQQSSVLRANQRLFPDFSATCHAFA